MSEYSEVEQPFLRQLEEQGWTIIDQGMGLPQDPAPSLRQSFRQRLLPEVFADSVRRINLTDGGRPWLTDAQLDDLQQQLLRQPNRTLLEANEAVQALLFKAQVDANELTGERDPVVRLVDFHHPENNRFHAINRNRSPPTPADWPPRPTAVPADGRRLCRGACPREAISQSAQAFSLRSRTKGPIFEIVR